MAKKIVWESKHYEFNPIFRNLERDESDDEDLGEESYQDINEELPFSAQLELIKKITALYNKQFFLDLKF